MNYIEAYRERAGHCEYCDRKGSNCCHECYGYAFKDKLGLFEFIRETIKTNAKDKFDSSERGIELIKAMDDATAALHEAKRLYDAEKGKFVDAALQKLEDKINAL